VEEGRVRIFVWEQPSERECLSDKELVITAIVNLRTVAYNQRDEIGYGK
jgi:hypothetical protein